MPLIKRLFIALPLYSHCYCSRLTVLTGCPFTYSHWAGLTIPYHIPYTFTIAISLVNSRYLLLLFIALFIVLRYLPLLSLSCYLTGPFCLIPLAVFSLSSPTMLSLVRRYNFFLHLFPYIYPSFL